MTTNALAAITQRLTLPVPAGSHYASTCSFRKVYIDAGVNWANTARLFEDLKAPSRTDAHWHVGWEIYGFEASPRIQPFADAYFAWLNGDTPYEPAPCVPRAGSSAHLSNFAADYGCVNMSTMDKMRQCMFSKLEAPLAAMRPEPRLNSSALVAARLERARSRPRDLAAACASHDASTSSKNRYNFVPAAVGTSDGYMALHEPPLQLIRGGAVPATNKTTFDPANTFITRVVDFPRWLATSFSLGDVLVVKLDVEGAEHDIIARLVHDGTIRYIHTLLIECHEANPNNGRCRRLLDAVRAAAPKTRIVPEGLGSWYRGLDSHSQPPAPEETRKLIRACQRMSPEDHGSLMLSWKRAPPRGRGPMYGHR